MIFRRHCGRGTVSTVPLRPAKPPALAAEGSRPGEPGTSRLSPNFCPTPSGIYTQHLLTQNSEEVKAVKVVQELLRHANSRITLDLYVQAGRTRGWHKATLFGAQQGKSTGLTRTKLGHDANPLQALERNGGDDGTRTRGLCRDRAAF
jgi:hypothetical protein